MMEPVKRIKPNDADEIEGLIKLDLPKTFWNLGMIFTALIFAPLTFSLEACSLESPLVLLDIGL